jgi:MotA/TolQ/ExbB proton channel family
MNLKFWKYWSILVSLVFLLLIGHFYFGIFGIIMAYDATYLTLINIAILFLAHGLMFRSHMKKQYAESDHKMIRYLGDTAVSLGLVGTLIGFMMLLWAVFGPGVIIDASNAAGMTGIIAAMAQGMAAALITSLAGILVSVIINLQLVILEQ